MGHTWNLSGVKHLRRSPLILVVFLLTACSGTAVMDMVNRDVSDKRLVASDEAYPIDPLNQYHHNLERPINTDLSLHLISERNTYLNTGESSLLLVGVTTRQPVQQPLQLHALIYDEAYAMNEHITTIGLITRELVQQADNLPQGSAITIDAAFQDKRLSYNKPALHPAENSRDLVKFLRSFAQTAATGQKQHFLLVLGGHEGLNKKEKQDCLDIINILQARSITTSVISFAEKPDFAFLAKLAENGHGTTYFHTPEADMQGWLSKDTVYISSPLIRDAKLTLQAENGVEIAQILSPRHLSHTTKQIAVTIPSLHLGDEYVLLAKIVVPPQDKEQHINTFTFSAEYYSPTSRRFERETITHSINFTPDKNQTLGETAFPIKRAEVILGTFDSLQTAEQYIRGERPYQAVAALTKQVSQIETLLRKKSDSELLRDSKVLQRYFERLLTFNDEWFQWVTIQRDLQWNADRYNYAYK